MEINYTKSGAVPEKSFKLKRGADGEFKQKPGVHEWEYEVKQDYRKMNPGYLVNTPSGDMRFAENTPLKLEINVHTPYKTDLIKQVKTVDDALTGAAYRDDSSIMILGASRIKDENEHLGIKITPASRDQIYIPDDCTPVVIQDILRPVQATGYKLDNNPIDERAYESDLKQVKIIRDAFDQQQLELVYGPCELYAEIGIRDIPKTAPYYEKMKMRNLEIFPNYPRDCDNYAYALIYALNHCWLDREDIVKIQIVKKFIDKENPASPVNRIWLREVRKNDNCLS